MKTSTVILSLVLGLTVLLPAFGFPIDPFKGSRAKDFAWRSDGGRYYMVCHDRVIQTSGWKRDVATSEEQDSSGRWHKYYTTFVHVEVSCPAGHKLEVWLDEDGGTARAVYCHDKHAEDAGYSSAHSGRWIRCQDAHTLLLRDGKID